MRVIDITIEGFGSYTTQTVIPFAEFTLAAVTGPVGAGKSTMFDALNWCMFGSTRAKTADSVVNHHTDTATVTARFDMGDGPVVSVTRTRQAHRGRTQVVVTAETGDEPQVLTTKSKDVPGILGLTADLFEGAVYAEQGEAGRFCRSDPATRRKLLGELLGLKRFERWRERSKSELGAQREQVAAAQAQVTLLSSQTEDVTVQLAGFADVDSRVAAAQNTAAEARDAETGAFNSLHAARQFHNEASTAAGSVHAMEQRWRADVDAARLAVAQTEKARDDAARWRDEFVTKLATAETAVGHVSDLDAQIVAAEQSVTAAADHAEAARNETELIRESGAAARQETETVAARIEETRERVALLTSKKQGECFVCGTGLDHDRVAGLVETLNTEIVELESRHAVMCDELDDMRAVAKAMAETANRAAEALNDTRNRLAGLQNARAVAAKTAADRDRLASQVAEFDIQLAAAVEAVEVNAARLGSLSERPAELVAADELAAKVDETASAVTEAERVHAAAAADVAETETVLAAATNDRARRDFLVEQSEQLVIDLKTADEDLTETQSETRKWETLTRMLAPTGLPAMVVAEAIPELQTVTNDLLTRLTGGTQTVEFRTTRELADGRNADTLDLVVKFGDTEQDYLSCSGGEKRRVDTATRIGLSRLLARRAGMDNGPLFLDESLDLFDSDAGTVVVDALADLVADGLFSQVMVITHQDRVAALLPQLIRVENDGSGTRLEWEL